jgi:hypothetical protein
MEKIVAYIAAVLTAASLTGSPIRAADTQQPQQAAEAPSHKARVTMGVPVSPEQQEAAKKARHDYAEAKKKARADYKKAVAEAKANRKQALADAKAAHDKVLHDISEPKK